MTEFVKGQWYTDGKQYWQYIKQGKDANGNTIHYIRLAGDVVEFAYDVDTLIPASLTPDFTNAKVGDECWLYGIGETGINSIGDNVTVWDDENKYVFDKSGYLYFIGEYIGDAYTQGVSCELEEFPMLFNSFAQFQAYWAEKALEMGGEK